MGLFDTFKRAAKGPGANSASANKPSVPSGKPADADRREAAVAIAEKRVIEKRLLFVNVASDWFQTVQSTLARLEPKWECRSFGTAPQAVAALDKESYFAVVVGNEGTSDSLLDAALKSQPASLVRVALCDINNKTEASRWTALGAQCLPLTIDAAGLAANVKRIALVHAWMADAGMKKLLSQCRRLPVMPKLYTEVVAELDSPNGSIDKAAHFVAKDPLMTAKILQVINSASFALGRQINDVCEAVMFLGLGRTRALIMMAGTFSQFEDASHPGASPEQVWNHSLQVATLAQIISLEETRDAKLGEAAFTSGLMHDMGKLILAANVPAMCTAVEQLQRSKHISRREAELQVLGTTHAELAACLLGSWGLPLPVLEAVAWHHNPSRASDNAFTPLTAVHAANVFSYEMGYGNAETAEQFDHDYLLQIGLGDRRNAWRETCGLPVKQEEDAEHKRARLRHESKLN